MKNKVNFYLAVLLIALLGAGAAFLLVRVATSANSFPTRFGGSEAKYDQLKKSILEQ